jgi:hypothetical protein
MTWDGRAHHVFTRNKHSLFLFLCQVRANVPGWLASPSLICLFPKFVAFVVYIWQKANKNWNSYKRNLMIV